MNALSIAQVIEKTSIGRTRLYKAIKDGQLRARRFGGRTLVLETDLQAFLEQLPTLESYGRGAK